MKERFEWLEIPEERPAKKRESSHERATVIGKRCPQCGWLDEETSTDCFRCGYRYNVDHDMAQRIEQLGVSPQPRLIESSQNLENFFRTHGRTRQPEPAGVYHLLLQARGAASEPGL